MKGQKKLSKAQRMVILARARQMFAARCSADRLWKSLVAVSAIRAEHRSIAFDRLCANAASGRKKNARLKSTLGTILGHVEHNINRGMKA